MQLIKLIVNTAINKDNFFQCGLLPLYTNILCILYHVAMKGQILETKKEHRALLIIIIKWELELISNSHLKYIIKNIIHANIVHGKNNKQ